MAMSAGNADCTTGLSKRIYDAWTGNPDSGFSATLSADQQKAVKAACFSIATAVYDEITTNAEVVGVAVT